LPTAELTLDGTPAHLIGGEGDGVRKIAAMFNVTRVYNAVAAVAGMRRAIALARDFATRRVSFGKPLSAHPLHAETLASLEMEWRAGFHLAFHVAELLGKQESNSATPEDLARLRLLIPVAKLYTAKQAVAVASEALECFGGAGYIEDTGLPRLLRDAQVLSIWEGTTNVLSLDVLRAMEKTTGFEAFVNDATRRCHELTREPLGNATLRVRETMRKLVTLAEQMRGEGRSFAAQRARGFSYTIARVISALLLLEHANWALANGDEDPARWAIRWCGRDLSAAITQEEGPVPSPILIG
jgi:hypothetical protein